MRVLLVDDEMQSRKSLVRVLTRMGVETVVEAATGEEALRLLPQLRPELIITDCQMPGMDGVRLTKALRATGIDMPIIMISGATERAMIDAAIRAGVTRFLAKPIEMADLRDALQETIGWASRAA
jgi:two-component system, response regulator YesN